MQLFPPYYMIAPIVEIVQHGGGWPDIAFDVSVLVGLTLALVLVVALAARRAREYEYAT